MMRALCAGLVAAVTATGSVLARPDRVLRTEVVVDASPAQLWEAFTTKAGWESWAVPVAEVDFRMGGTIRTNYNKEAGVGGPGTITHHILAYEPERMLTLRFESQGNAGWAKIAEGTWNVIRFEPVSATRTRMVETMVGWGQGPEWDDSYEHFKAGNAWTAEQLKKKFARAEPGDADAVLALLHRMVGGDWVCRSTGPDGTVFRVRNLVEAAPDGKGVIARGWLGDDSGMDPHSATQVWREGPEVLFQSLDQDGAVARGTIHAGGDKTLTWDWNQASRDGQLRRFTVAQTFEGPDAYHMTLSQAPADGTTQVLVNITLARVRTTPPEYLRMRGAAAGTEPGAATIDCSLFAAAGMVEGGLIKEVVVRASPAEAFRAWATPEGLKSFLVQDCNADLRIGGPYELYFGGPDVAQDQRGSNGCQILSYVPGEMISFSWNAPPKFPAERAQRAWVVVTFAPAEDGHTKVRLVHTGFGVGGQWPQVREYFDRAWDSVLAAMRDHFEH